MSESVKVIVRCRPLNEKEREMKTRLVVETNASLQQCSIKRPWDDSKISKTFTFDGVYGISSSTETIYSEIVHPIVNGVLDGYNGTVFAYGQTSCGKTFTMEGIESPSAQKGIIPRCCEHILSVTRQRSFDELPKYLLRVSYLEIYNEEIRDLLVKECRYKPEIKEHPDKGIYVKGLSSITVDSYEDMQEIFESGGKHRSVGATALNADSSRSHSIFTVDLESCLRSHPGEKEVYRTGKLNLVDLAGSERQSKSGCTGERFKESTKINLSLSVLGNVISALVDGKCKYVPYRDSKLTRLLQDSLGGNSRTLMVACISPGENNYEETLSTLRYAKRAKDIRNKPKINEDPKDTIIKRYHDEIQQLKRVIAKEIPVPRQLVTELKETTEETISRTSSYYQTLAQRHECHLSQSSVKEYQMRLFETQKLHIKACEETTTLKRELDELRAQLQIQRKRYEYEARRSMLEEHKTALMLLRGRRIADGCSASDNRNLARVNHSETHSSSLNLPKMASYDGLSQDITPKDLSILPAQTNLDYSNFDCQNLTDVTSETERASEPEGKTSPEVPAMISVSTSTDDLQVLETDVDLTDEDQPKKEWNIRENILCRDEAEGRSRSASPYTEEKKSYAGVQAAKSEVIYPLDEEGSVSVGLCCLCPEISFFGERFHSYQHRRLEEVLRKKQKLP
ncbi:kinesin-like protein KIF17 isoform X1 [Stylophora pistillata]|uniref:kinesin-like protein KIF17 isoform X1 n=1 Tax=Stylophora pistillata TaxID=50429 RepID=UPI000C03AFAA|nr:kinesin-like protein KIF17 isoform X1 [Stylophora pistillata]